MSVRLIRSLSDAQLGTFSKVRVMLYLITARKRSLRRFCLYACLSVILFMVGGLYPSMPCRYPGPHPGGKLRGLALGDLQSHTQEGGLKAHTRGVVSRPTPGGCVFQHALRQTPPPADSYCCGQYASYWNAFLCKKKFILSN